MVAVIVTLAEAFAGEVAMVAVADVTPAGTVTLAIVAAPGVKLVSLTRSPPAGAGPVSVTVAVDEVPPLTDLGLNVSVETAAAGAAVTVSSVVAVVPPYEAEMFTSVVLATADVVTVNVLVVLPFMIDTVAGTATPGALLERLTTAPPFGAGKVSVTVAVALVPPVTLDGASVSVTAGVAMTNDRETSGAGL